MPYLNLAVANMYLEWTGEKTFEIEETGLSDGAVIGITVGSYVAFILLVCIFAVIAAFAGIAVGTYHGDFDHSNDFDIDSFYHEIIEDYHM